MLTHINKINCLSKIISRHLSLSEKFRDILIFQRYDDILEFEKIDTKKFLGTSDMYLFAYERLFQKAGNKVVEHIINKTCDLEYYNKEEKRLIHYISKYCNDQMLQCIINKEIKLNDQDSSGNTPIHYICTNRYRNINMLKLMYDNEVYFDIQNNNGWLPLHEICYNGSSEEIMYIFNLSYEYRNKRITNWYDGTKCEFLSRHLISFNQKLNGVEKDIIIDKFITSNMIIKLQNK